MKRSVTLLDCLALHERFESLNLPSFFHAQLRKFRAFCTVDMLRYTWEKTTNPYIRAFTWFHRPSLGIARQMLLPRPSVGAHNKRPIRAWLFYPGTERQLRDEEELVLDFPGGGFVCMTPQHHEERLRQLAKQMRKPVLAIDYCKAPEYPYPYALEECYDVYRSLFESRGKIIGMSGNLDFRVLLSGDSAGGNLATAVIFKIIEYPQARIQKAYAAKTIAGGRVPPLPKPIGVLLSYPCLNFGFSSWMKPEHLRVLRQQSEVNLDNLAQSARNADAHGSSHRSSSKTRRSSIIDLQQSRSQDFKRSQKRKSAAVSGSNEGTSRSERTFHSLAEQAQLHLDERARFAEAEPTSDEGGEPQTPPAPESVWAESTLTPSWEKSGLPWHEVDAQAKADQRRAKEEAAALARYEKEQRALQAAAEAADRQSKDQQMAPVNTRLTLTSMAGYFQDRIITQGMLRAMAIYYIGPKRQPDFDNDYMLSPIVAPSRLLAEFPPVLFICGEKDPLCDDTVVMAGRIREAKLAKKAQLERRRAGQSARFGEQLRMSNSSAGNSSIPRDAIEDESPGDWVQMRIIEGWSHGFLQMSSLLPEAKEVISFLGTWLSLTFEDYKDRLEESKWQHSGRSNANKGMNKSVLNSPAQPETGLKKEEKEAGVEEEEEEEEEDDGPLTFVPKGRRSPNRGFESPQPNASISGSPIGSPRVGQKSPEILTNKLPAGSLGLLASPKVESLRREQADASRSSSPGGVKSATGTAAGLGSPALVASDGPERGGNDTNLTQRRGSKNGATALEEKYKAMLVTEADLLKRRRDDVVFGLGHTASAIQSEDDEEDLSRSRTHGSSDPVHDDGHGDRGRSSAPRAHPLSASVTARAGGGDAPQNDGPAPAVAA